ncbi:hypothetical protein V8F06_013427 [Rhypophila decipiens]
MEPLSCLAIAGAVMQVITFGNDVIVLHRKIKKNGSIDDGLEGKSVQIATNARLVEDNLAKTTGRPLTEDDMALLDVARKCLSCSKALIDVMNNIKWKAARNGGMTVEERSAFGQAWKARRYKSEIEKLEKDLKGVQETMNRTILVSSWLSGKAAAAEQQEGFGNLDSQIQQFINSQAEYYRQTSTKITEESAEIKKVIKSQAEILNNQFVDHAKAQVDQEQRLLFLGSLQFPAMGERKSRVSKAHDKTFRWIFKDDISRPWDSFTTWLRSEDQVYWISGKPGSGKSTLMKYLVGQEITREILAEWDPSVTIVSFYLWSAGVKLQKSVQGVLCALLSQILQSDEELVCTLLGRDIECLEKRRYSDWSDEELEALLVNAINASNRRICMFLDGLDEIDRREGPFPMIQLVQTLQSKTHAKLCLSSRPEAEFQDAFGEGQTLRLEDLTKEDIKIYVEDYFQKHLSFWDTENAATENKTWRREITHEILNRAHGVFLWVFLVLRSLRSGTSNADSYDQLFRRVRQLPSTLEQLYRQAWERHGENEQIYRDEAASYFKLALQSQQMMDIVDVSNSFAGIPFSLLEFLLAHDSHLRKALLEGRLIPPAKTFISKTHELQRRIETRSGGLLEVFRLVEPTPEDLDKGKFLESCVETFFNQFLVPFSLFLDCEKRGSGALVSGGELVQLWNVSQNLGVGFIHRTAADFVSNTEWGNKLIIRAQKSDQEIQIGLCEARLAHSLLYMFSPRVHQLMSGAFEADASDFYGLFNHIQFDISREQYISLCKNLELVHTQLIDSSPKIDQLIADLSMQIREGKFDSDYCRVMHEFIESGIIHNFEFIWGKDENDSPPNLFPTRFKVIQNLASLADLSRQILAKCRIGRLDPLAGCSLTFDLPLFPLPSAILSPTTSMQRIAAHVVFSAWVLADSRDMHRYRTVKLLGRLSLAAIHNDSDCLQNSMDRWPHIYKMTAGFKEMLMSAALFDGPRRVPSIGSAQVVRNTAIRQLLSIGADPNRTTSSSGCRYRVTSRCSVPYSLFEWFLIDVPDRCQQEQVLGIESSIISTINAFLAAGGRMDRRICLPLGPFPVPLRPLTIPRRKPDNLAVAYNFIVETDSIQLLDRAKRALKARAEKLRAALEGFDDLPDTGRAFDAKVCGVVSIGRPAETEKQGAFSTAAASYFHRINAEDLGIVAEQFNLENPTSPQEWIEDGFDFTTTTRGAIRLWQNEKGSVEELSVDPDLAQILYGGGLKTRIAAADLYEKWFPEWAYSTTSDEHIKEEQEILFVDI